MTTTLRTWNLKISLSLLLCLTLCGLLSAQTPSWQYVSTVGGNGQYSAKTDEFHEGVNDMAVDKWGNTYVVGSTGSSPEANGTAISPANYGGDFDAYVAKYNRCGALEWMYVSGTSENDVWNGVVVDEEGNCYVNGFGGNQNFRFVCNSTDTTYVRPNTGICPFAFWFKLNPQGKKVWIKPFNGANGSFGEHYITMSPNNNLYLLFNRNKMNNVGDTLYNVITPRSSNMLAKIDIQTGNIVRYSFIDSLFPCPYIRLTADENENIYSVVSNCNASDSIRFIGGHKLIIYTYGPTFLELDSNFRYKNSIEAHPNTGSMFVQYFSVFKDKIVASGVFTEKTTFGGVYYPKTHSYIGIQNIIWTMDKDLGSIKYYYPDTSYQIGNVLLGGASADNMYLLYSNRKILKWGGINRPTKPNSFIDTTMLARITTSTFGINNVAPLLDFAQTNGAPYEYTISRNDEQGNVYFTGLFGDKITIPGKSVTPKGGQPSPDGFVLKWGLPCSDSTHALIPPKDPSKLIATAASATRVNVNWSDNAQYETGYRIFRSPDGISNWTKIDSVNKNVTAYADLNVQPNNVYWYKVQGYNAIGATDWTNIDSAKTPMTIGITEITGVSYFNVFPNPTKGNTVTIELAQEKAAVYQVALTDLSGRTLQYFNWNTEAGSNKKTIEVSGLSKGIYSLTLRTASAQLTRELVVVE